MGKKQPAEQQATCTNSDSWNCKYCNKTKTCAALAAGQATAAQPGVVYAELPVPNYPKSGGFQELLLKRKCAPSQTPLMPCAHPMGKHQPGRGWAIPMAAAICSTRVDSMVNPSVSNRHACGGPTICVQHSRDTPGTGGLTKTGAQKQGFGHRLGMPVLLHNPPLRHRRRRPWR